MADNVVQMRDRQGNPVFPIAGGIAPALIMDVFYPVGSYYETSDTTFDPNDAWGGTWVEDTKGRVTVAKADSGTFSIVGSTGGAETNTIASGNLPKHTHTYSKSPANTGGTAISVAQMPSHNHGGNTGDQYAYDTVNIYTAGNGSGGDNFKIVSWNNQYVGDDVRLREHFKHKHSISSQGSGNTHSHTITVTSANTGDGGFANTAMTNLQPYVVVKRWHRTA